VDFGRYVFSDPYLAWLCRGVAMTLLISLASACGAAVIGAAVLRCQLSPRRPLRALGAAFVMVFRNLPLVPLLLFVTFGLPGMWRELTGSALPRGLELYLLVLALALNTAAYVVEIVRAGITSIEPEQVEAARVLGLPPRAVRRRIIYPQALRITAPALASRFIHNMKNSTLALIVPLPVGAMELVGQAGRIAGETFSWAEPLIAAACVHVVLALALGRLLNRWASREQKRIGLA
jgi:His/Glu/Gln/Arg/opine family amino acid ABC transporter permease subunit